MKRVLATVFVLVLAACEEQPTQIERGTAALLGTITHVEPDGDLERAQLAMARDAWRREQRFLDAANPGHLFASTRLTQDEIDHGLWTPGELFELGGQLFMHQFSTADGFGGGDGPRLRRFQDRDRGGPDAYGCTSCHWRGGLAGGGDAADNAMLGGDGIHEWASVARNPPALIGAGVRERLAAEMSAELAALRDDAIARARREDRGVRQAMAAKGVSFGYITARADGSVDTAELVGVDDDLVVRPFGWRGDFSSIRGAAEEALATHHGMQSTHRVATASARVLGPRDGADPDGDGVADEITEGQLSALVSFVALLETPTETLPQTDPYLATLWARGRLDFESFGCAVCHTPAMTLDDASFVLPHRDGGPDLVLDLLRDGDTPRIGEPDTTIVVRLYSDLKRHRMGDAVAETRSPSGLGADEFMTPALWGVSRSRPYLHDGRAPTLEDAILLHGGEASASRDAFAALDDAGRAPLRVFLTSLGRTRRVVTP